MANTSPTQVVNAGYWSSDGTYPVANINTDLFTHLFFAFANIDPVTKHVVIPTSKLTQVSTFSSIIKANNPNVRTLLSIKDKNEIFRAMAERSSARSAFIASSLQLARQHNFDGLDFQWLYPSALIDMNNLGLLVSEWHNAIVSEALQQQKPQLLLVQTVYYSPFPNSLVYPTAAMKTSLDWIHVLAYDFYTPTSSPEQTGPTSAYLNPTNPNLSVSYGLQQWITSFPAEKMVLGLPFYGYAWLLQSATGHGIFAPADGPAIGQAGVSSDGEVDYGSIVNLINTFSAKKVYDDKYILNYAFYGTVWIGYDDVETVTAKIGKVKPMGLLGYYVWRIGGDDQLSTLSETAYQQWNA